MRDIDLVRTYCRNNLGNVLDFNYASKHVFSSIKPANLRTYVVRLVKYGTLRQISKGVFLIGESSLSDEERVIRHYTSDFDGSSNGILAGEALLYDLGIIDKKPDKTLIYSNLTVGNKNIGNVRVEQLNVSYYFEMRDLVILLELIRLYNIVDPDSGEYFDAVQKYIFRIPKIELNKELVNKFRRNVFVALDSYLRLFNKSNHEVKKQYADLQDKTR